MVIQIVGKEPGETQKTRRKNVSWIGRVLSATHSNKLPFASKASAKHVGIVVVVGGWGLLPSQVFFFVLASSSLAILSVDSTFK